MRSGDASVASGLVGRTSVIKSAGKAIRQEDLMKEFLAFVAEKGVVARANVLFQSLASERTCEKMSWAP
jgi:hypothetical protein